MQRLFLLILTVGLTCAPPVGAQQSGIIGGVVRNGWSKEPIKRAIVTLRTTGATLMEALTYSEASGAFAFTGVPAGEYTLCARVSGYERACFGGGDDQGRPIALLTLGPGQKKQDVVLAMLPTGSVSGTVLDPDGDPASNAHVVLLRPLFSRRTLHWETAGQAMTNEKGEYHLAFVQPGDYRVKATSQSQQASLTRPEAVAGQAVQEELYTAQYYPGVPTIDAATSLTLNAGNDVKGIDFTLAATPQLSISGVVRPPPGMEKEGNVTIGFLAEPRRGTGQELNFGASAPDYAFQANVPAGRYHVFTFAEEKDREYRGEQWLDATSSTNNVILTLAAGTPLTGKLIFEGESLGTHGPYNIHLTAGDDSEMNGAPPTAEVSDSGAFEFSSVFPGVWDIGVHPLPPGSYIKSMRLGDQDVLTKDMKLEEGGRKPLTIVLSTKGAVVSGNVVMKDQTAPVTTIRSRLLLAPAGKFEDVLGFYRTTMTDAKGHFEFKGIPPGTYRIYAFDRLKLDEYWKPDFLKPFTAAAGDAFVLSEGVRVNQDATLILRDGGVPE